MEIIPFIPAEDDRENKKPYTAKYDFGSTNYVPKDQLHANRSGRYNDAPRMKYHEARPYLLDKRKNQYNLREYTQAA